MSNQILRVALLALCLILCLGALPACASKGSSVSVNDFSSLTLNAKKETVTAKVNLNQNIIKKHKGESVYLYELTAALNTDRLPEDAQPVATQKLSSSVSFTFDLYDGERSRLYSSFAVGFEDGSFLFPEGRWIDNPEALSKNEIPFSRVDLPKGLYAADTEDAVALGASRVMYEISFFSLLSEEKDATLGLLDKQIRQSCDAGLQVSLSVKPNRLLPADECAALFALLAERFAGGENGGITAIFVDMGSFPLDQLTPDTSEQIRLPLLASYAALYCRLANQALLSQTQNGRVYVNWGSESLSDTKSFFSQTSLLLSAGGEIAWGASYDLPTPGTDATTPIGLTENELFDLSSYLTSASIEGHAEWFALNGIAFSAENPEMQAASFAYAYRAALRANATAVFYTAHFDDAYGLRAADRSDRKITALYTDIEKGLSLQDERMCQSLLGEEWDKLSPYTATGRVTVGSASAGLGGLSEQSLFDFTTGQTYGFSGVGSIRDPRTHESAAYSAPVLYTWLAPTYGNSAGVRKILDDPEKLSDALSLSVRLLTQAKGSESCTAKLQLRGTSEDGGLLTHTSQIEIQNGKWQTVTFQIADFTAEADLSRPCVLTLTVEPQNPTEEPYVMWVRGMDLRKPDGDHGALLPILLIAGGTLIGFAAAVLIYRAIAPAKPRSVTRKKRAG